MKETYYLNLNLIASERNTNDIKPGMQSWIDGYLKQVIQNGKDSYG
jgi:hypothetical protein